MKPPVAFPLLLVAALVWQLNAESPPNSDKTAAGVRAVMAAEDALRDIPLRDVIAAAAGRRVLPLEPDKFPGDAACRDLISSAADKLLTRLNAPDSPAKGLRRINEASRIVEDNLVALLDGGDFTCRFPTPASGEQQRSGYPDLRIVHKPSGRVYYLDPKIYEARSAQSTLRSFYYEPKELTGKVRDDACHLVLGISHDGADGAWRFTGWRLVDLHNFHVRLKAEFQASNKDLYREEFTVGKSK